MEKKVAIPSGPESHVRFDEKMFNAIEALRHQGERCLELSKALNDRHGRELNKEEKQLLRIALLPQLQERLDIMTTEFVSGKEVESIDMEWFRF